MPAVFLIIITIIGWGIGGLLYKKALDNIHPMMVSTIVTLIYVILTPFTFMFLQFDRSVNGDGVLYSILGGLFMCAGSLGYFYALRGGSAGAVTVLTSLYPALTLVLALIFMKETVSVKQWLGILLALISFILMSIK